MSNLPPSLEKYDTRKPYNIGLSRFGELGSHPSFDYNFLEEEEFCDSPIIFSCASMYNARPMCDEFSKSRGLVSFFVRTAGNGIYGSHKK